MPFSVIFAQLETGGNVRKQAFLDCKTFIRRFDSDRRLNRINKSGAAARLPPVV
jgi:hypothetical protein